MKAIVFLVAAVWLMDIDSAASADLAFDATVNVTRNKMYFAYLNTDFMHSACYYTFCYCGNLKYAGHQTPLHEESCDLHRSELANENVYKCLKNKPCLKDLKQNYNGTFEPLFNLIQNYEISATKREYPKHLDACKFYLSTCYGLLLKETIKLYNYGPYYIREALAG